MDKTSIVNSDEINTLNIKSTLLSIIDDLKDRGYNPIKQIVAYLVSGDPGYISSYKECRSRILSFSKEDILETMLKEFIG